MSRFNQKRLKTKSIIRKKNGGSRRLIAIFPRNSHGVCLQALSWMSTKPYIASSELSPGGLQVSST